MGEPEGSRDPPRQLARALPTVPEDLKRSRQSDDEHPPPPEQPEHTGNHVKEASRTQGLCSECLSARGRGATSHKVKLD